MTVHLMVRSCYTLLDSTIRISEMVSYAKQLGYDAIALTDRNVMHGMAEFEHACRKEGIRPIFGLELDVKVRNLTVPFLLLAKTNGGFTNLSCLSTMVMSEEKPVEFEVFRQYLSGVFVIVYGEGGFCDSELMQDRTDEILEKLSWLKENLPVFDIALSYQDSGMWKLKNKVLKRCAASLGIRTLAVNKI